MQCIRNNEAIKEANVKGPDFFSAHTKSTNKKYKNAQKTRTRSAWKNIKLVA